MDAKAHSLCNKHAQTKVYATISIRKGIILFLRGYIAFIGTRLHRLTAYATIGDVPKPLVSDLRRKAAPASTSDPHLPSDCGVRRRICLAPMTSDRVST